MLKVPKEMIHEPFIIKRSSFKCEMGSLCPSSLTSISYCAFRQNASPILPPLHKSIQQRCLMLVFGGGQWTLRWPCKGELQEWKATIIVINCATTSRSVPSPTDWIKASSTRLRCTVLFPFLPHVLHLCRYILYVFDSALHLVLTIIFLQKRIESSVMMIPSMCFTPNGEWSHLYSAFLPALGTHFTPRNHSPINSLIHTFV